jgi:hypothetical protein
MEGVKVKRVDTTGHATGDDVNNTAESSEYAAVANDLGTPKHY